MTQDFQLTYNAPPTVARFMDSRAFVACIMGPVGSGKSSGVCFKLLQLNLEQPPSPIDGIRRARTVIIRNTYNDLEATTLQTFNDWFPPEIFPGYYMRTRPPKRLIEFHTDPDPTSEFEAERKNGRHYHMEFWFIALDREEHVRKLKSLEMTNAWINEGSEVVYVIYKHLTTRVGRYPAMRHGGAPQRCVLIDTNPPDKKHWIHDVFEKKKLYPIYKQPSGLAPNAENIENLPVNYYIEMMKNLDEDEIEVLVKGNFGSIKRGEPVYGKFFNSSIHVANENLDALPKEMNVPLHIGVDFGLTPAAGVWQKRPNGQWVMLAEFVPVDSKGDLIVMGAEQFAPALKTFLGERFGVGYPYMMHGDPAGNHRSETDSTVTPMTVFWKKGLNIHPAPTNDLKARLMCVRNPLRRLVDGQPGLLIDPRCERSIAGFGGDYHYRKTRIMGVVKLSDVPEKNDASHIMNGNEYALSGGGEFLNIRLDEEEGATELVTEPMVMDVGFNPLSGRSNQWKMDNSDE